MVLYLPCVQLIIIMWKYGVAINYVLKLASLHSLSSIYCISAVKRKCLYYSVFYPVFMPKGCEKIMDIYFSYKIFQNRGIICENPVWLHVWKVLDILYSKYETSRKVHSINALSLLFTTITCFSTFFRRGRREYCLLAIINPNPRSSSICKYETCSLGHEIFNIVKALSEDISSK